MAKKYSLKNETPYTIRETRMGDAKSLIDFLDQVSKESDNLTFGPGDLLPTLEKERSIIKTMLDSQSSLSISALLNNKVIANLGFNAGTRSRVKHCGEFGVSVLKEFWGNGIASALIEYMINWAESGHVTKINLRVREDNKRAIALYEHFGFEKEGLLRREFKIDGVYYDFIMMGKIITTKQHTA